MTYLLLLVAFFQNFQQDTSPNFFHTPLLTIARKERTIPLNSSARKALRNYFEGRSLEEERAVFLSKQNKKMTVRAVQKVINSLAGKAGIENMSPHTLRHTFAINYLRSNPECLVELSALLGHESLDTTSIYTAASKERLANTVENARQYINE